ncbi:hypothetical protein PN441_17755 [Spirulina major CS-329]|nr:hypothetical protein [Spirulina subsalsa CS-330]MDB9504928.1 hypothetical protein [Spirulina major CS-329]
MKKRLSCKALSLALYQEVAAQLRQVQGVLSVEIELQEETAFDYAHSQVGALLLTLSDDLPPASDLQLQTILDYYAQSFGLWHEVEYA